LKRILNLKITNNEKGISLVEVLASIVILTIILASILNFFPQMGQKNIQNENKQSAINLAKIELDKWKTNIESSSDFNTFLVNPTLHSYSFINSDDTVTYNSGSKSITIQTKSTNPKFNVVVVISTESDLASTPKKAYQIQVKIYKGNNILVSQTYGYIFYGV